MTDDVAFNLALPFDGIRAGSSAAPIVYGNFAYVPVEGSLEDPLGPTGVGVDVGAVFRVDLETAEISTFASVDDWIYEIATDGTSLFVLTEDGHLLSFPMVEGAPSWDLQLSIGPKTGTPSPARTDVATCEGLAVDHRSIFVACNDASIWAAPVLTVLRIDIESGNITWRWVLEQEAGPEYADDIPGKIPLGASGAKAQIGGLSVINDVVFLVLYTTTRETYTQTASQHVRAVHETFGISRSGETVFQWGQIVGDTRFDAEPELNGEAAVPPRIVGNATAQFLKSQLVFRYGFFEESGPTVDYRDFRQGVFEPDDGTTMAFDGEFLYATSRKSIHRISPGLVVHETRRLDGADEFWDRGDLVRAPNGIVARASRLDQASGISAAATTIIHFVDAMTLETIWSREFFSQAVYAPAPQGLVVRDGAHLILIGRTAASLQPNVVVSGFYPVPGETLTVKLEGTKPGIQGPADRFAVDWGDGTPLKWQNTPVFSHQYGVASDFRARVIVANSAGQSSSLGLDFHVGQDDPSKNTFELAFTPKYQERTFFILGAFLTLLLAALGILRRRLRHARFQRELSEIDAAYARHRADPDGCVAVLEEKRHHVRDLLLRRKVDESHAGTLERRVDELHRMVRMQLIDERFEFLPHGVVKRLRAVLEDGLVTRLEQSQIEDVLGRDPTLGAEQKDRIRKVLATWSGQDEIRAANRVKRPSA